MCILCDVMKMIMTADPPKELGRTTIKHDGGGFLIVSTMVTPEHGPETAVVDDDHGYPVERYKTEEEAKEGHKRWCEKAKSVTNVIMLGSEIWNVKDEERTITPMLKPLEPVA